jgi:hypothetical protein
MLALRSCFYVLYYLLLSYGPIHKSALEHSQTIVRNYFDS